MGRLMAVRIEGGEGKEIVVGLAMRGDKRRAVWQFSLKDLDKAGVAERVETHEAARLAAEKEKRG